MKEKRFKIRWKQWHKSYNSFTLFFQFKYHSATLKEKYATHTQPGHWRVEIGEWFQIYFLFWCFDIYFNDNYWWEECDRRNKES